MATPGFLERRGRRVLAADLGGIWRQPRGRHRDFSTGFGGWVLADGATAVFIGWLLVGTVKAAIPTHGGIQQMPAIFGKSRSFPLISANLSKAVGGSWGRDGGGEGIFGGDFIGFSGLAGGFGGTASRLVMLGHGH